MKGYEKPVILENIELFEAVYAESGYQGNYIKVTVTLPGSVRSISDFSGPYTSCDVNGNTVVFIRDGAFNPNESFQFSINHAECEGSGEDNHDITEHQGSFFETGTHIGTSDGLSVSIEVA